jgi:3-dehydrosphinganine reductase
MGSLVSKNEFEVDGKVSDRIIL